MKHRRIFTETLYLTYGLKEGNSADREDLKSLELVPDRYELVEFPNALNPTGDYYLKGYGKNSADHIKDNLSFDVWSNHPKNRKFERVYDDRI